jgi:outer membrane lipoprotein-sorting protein
MKILKTMITMCGVLLIASTALSQSDTATQEKLAEIGSKIEKINSCRVTMIMEMQVGHAVVIKAKMAVKKPDKMFMKFENEMMGETYSSGDVTWKYIPSQGKAIKKEGKNRSGMAGASTDITNPFKGIAEDKIKYIEEKDSSEGRVYVFEAYPDFGADMPAGSHHSQTLPKRMTIWLSADTGLPAKIIMIGPNGAAMMEQTFSDFEINPEINDSAFDFTPPEGVQVVDMTAGTSNKTQQMQGSHPK